MIHRPLRLLASLVLVAAVSACGFQLRDALRLPAGLDPVKVVAKDRYSPLAESLAQSLTRAGAEPADASVASPAVLDIKAERWGDTPIGVDSQGRAQELMLRYAVVFELRNGDGTVLVPEQHVELSRAYISVPTNALGTEGERDILVRELQREMTSAVLRRIDAASGDRSLVDDPSEVFQETTDAARAAMEAADAVAPPPDPESGGDPAPIPR